MFTFKPLPFLLNELISLLKVHHNNGGDTVHKSRGQTLRAERFLTNGISILTYFVEKVGIYPQLFGGAASASECRILQVKL